ncbi:hypothetical protein PMAC_001912 [Pneumocystis sp. 'macacae']|nr:hypothetical protein PMAC_001912 [Pneumocystis sp. 'macacae']
MGAQKQSLNIRKVPKQERNEHLASNKKKNNINVQSLGVELFTDPIPHFNAKNDKVTPRKSSSESHKQLDHYAGPTFHHSPAASNLPIPTFLSKLVNDTPKQHSSPHSEQSQLYRKQSPSRTLSSDLMHKLFEHPHSPIISQSHSGILEHEKVVKNASFYDDFSPLTRGTHFSSLKLMSQTDTKGKKQKQVPLKRETATFSEVDKKEKTKQGVVSSTHSSDLIDTHQKSRNNGQKSFSKKKRNWSKYNSYTYDHISEKEDLKNKLLSLLLPSSSISDKSTNFSKSKT